MKKIKISIHAVISILFSAIILVAITIGNYAAFSNYHVVTAYTAGTGLDQNSKESKAARESGNLLAQKVSEEGVVLLKNINNSLPLTQNKVNVFGVAGSNSGFIPMGTGSGTGSRNDLMTFLDGIEEAGIEYNPSLAADYDRLNYKRIDGGYVIEAYTDQLYKKYYGVLEADNNFYNDERMEKAREYSSTAIVVIGRILGEGNDYSKIQYINNEDNNPDRKLQTISQREEYMLEQVTKYFDNVVLVLNTSNPMELGFVEDYDIDSVLYMGLPGTRGTIGVGNVLLGKVNPSGKLTDTWAYDLSSNPSYATSGREGVGSYLDISSDTTLGTRANKYSDYIEDIYVGYKWYETADVEGFWDDLGGYNNIVQYPFGFGLSYTKFKWTVTMENYLENQVIPSKDGKIKFKVLVENIGDVAGKDVVQLYYSTPYTKGGIEKSALTLGTFAKTALLNPGEIETIIMEFDIEDMKSYDAYDKNNNGFMGYELEKGEYTFSFRTDSHNLAQTSNGKNEFKLNIGEEGFKYEFDSVTGFKVENQFTNYTNPISGASSTINEPHAKNPHSIDGNDEPIKIKYLTRENFQETFPYEKPENRNAGALIDDAHYVMVTPRNNPNDVAPKENSRETNWMITDLFGVPYHDPMWDELVGQLSLDVKARLIAQGGFGTIAIESIGKPRTADADGPTGFNNSVIGQGNLKAVNYPSSTVLAQTWDWYMAYQVGLAIGIEANALGIQGWYGPGANLHRSPMGGRNFEYYSEDPRITGIMTAYTVYGAKEKGVTSYIKHIAVNDSESGRNGAYKWLTEQNFRETYLLPFEIAVKVGKANGMMTSVDRIGSTRASGSYAMLTTVLRDEWGFSGTVITDYYQHAGKSSPGHTIHDIDEAVRAGNSQMLFQDRNPGLGWFDDATSATAKIAIHKSAKDILFAYADTLHFAETAQGLESGNLIGTSIYVFPWWVVAIIALDIVVVGGLSFWMFKAIRPKRRKENLA